MAQRKQVERAPNPAEKIYPDMPNHFATDAEFCAAVDIGLAEIDAGQTVSIDAVVANFQRKFPRSA